MIYRFGDIEVDLDGFELKARGEARAVEPLVFDLIGHLVRNPNRVIARDELVEHVWKGRVVSDATVSGAIKQARRALAHGGAETSIQTVRGRGFRFVADVCEAPSGAPRGGNAAAPAPRTASTELPMVAVLPFENLSSEFDEYFADGLTVDIIARLSRFREFLVIARSSTFRFKGQAPDLATIARELGARYVVAGSVRRAAGRVRISADLVDAETGVQLWAATYDREMEDIFAVQDDVTRTIAASLGGQVQEAGLQRSLVKNLAELGAYDCVLRARRYTWTLDADSHAEARDLLESAVRQDPNYADAHALLANVYLAEHRFGTNPRPDPMGRALAMAQTAVHLDPHNAYARCWLAIVYFFRHENDKFEAEAVRALELNPNDPEILADIGHYFAFIGQFERGVELSSRAIELNPLHPGWYHFGFARYHYDRREYAATVADLERAAMPEFYWAHMLRAAALGQLGDPGARSAVEQLLALRPDFDARAELEKWNAAPDDREHLLEGLRKSDPDG